VESGSDQGFSYPLMSNVRLHQNVTSLVFLTQEKLMISETLTSQ